MKVFVINLPESKARRDSIEKSLSKYGIEYEIFQAVKGSDLNREQDPRIYNEECFEIVNNRFSKTSIKGKLTDGELGAALSHLMVYQKILDECPSGGGVVCEDDAVLHCNIVKLAEAILEKQKGVQLINFHSHAHRGLRQGWFVPRHNIATSDYSGKYFKAGVPGLNWFLNRRRRSDGTVAYYISKDGCQRLIDIGYPVRMEADRLTGMAAFNKLNSYIVDPCAVSLLDVQSDIGSGRGQKAY